MDRSTDGGVSLDSVHVRDDSRQHHAEEGGKTFRDLRAPQDQHWIVYQRPDQLPAGQNEDRQSMQDSLLSEYFETSPNSSIHALFTSYILIRSRCTGPVRSGSSVFPEADPTKS